mmetsp:Transcript_24467/g.21645  ORF Transcript_24467/g.21645 Transcript_24467/m.21645 type:complete len:80 (+) Transcript_24467:79-318(+)
MISSFKKTFPFLTKYTFNKSTPMRAFSRLATHREDESNTDSVPFEFTPENYERIQELLARYPSNYKKSAMIPVLTVAQK